MINLDSEYVKYLIEEEKNKTVIENENEKKEVPRVTNNNNTLLLWDYKFYNLYSHSPIQFFKLVHISFHSIVISYLFLYLPAVISFLSGYKLYTRNA